MVGLLSESNEQLAMTRAEHKRKARELLALSEAVIEARATLPAEALPAFDAALSRTVGVLTGMIPSPPKEAEHGSDEAGDG